MSTFGDFPIDTRFLWDCRPTGEEIRTEGFRDWYLARVLTKGSWRDLQSVGFPVIRDRLPRLHLARELRDFWEWYFRARDSHTAAA